MTTSSNFESLLVAARAVAADVAAKHAADVDTQARFPRESIDALRAAGILSAPVPKALGGGGCSMRELALLCSTLSQACASSGMVLAMHYIQVACIARHGLSSQFFRDYLREVVEVARRTGYTQTMLNQRRYLPDLTSDNRQRREKAERMALNAPIQGSAADVIKVAMLRVDAALAQAQARSRVLLQVHDELVLEIADGERADVEALVVEAMGSAIAMDVPLDVSVGAGRSWEAAGH